MAQKRNRGRRAMATMKAALTTKLPSQQEPAQEKGTWQKTQLFVIQTLRVILVVPLLLLGLLIMAIPQLLLRILIEGAVSGLFILAHWCVTSFWHVLVAHADIAVMWCARTGGAAFAMLGCLLLNRSATEAGTRA